MERVEQWPHSRLGWLALGLALGGLPRVAAGQSQGSAPVIQAGQPAGECIPETNGVLGSVQGRAIARLDVRTEGPAPLPGTLRFVTSAHMRTRAGVAAGLFGIAPGDVADTLELAEAVRRVRQSGLFSAVALSAADCGSGGAVALRLVTRDRVSARVTPRFASLASSSLAVEEANLLGTGRRLSVGVATDGNRLGLRLAAADPLLLAGHGILSGRFTTYRDGRSWGADLRPAPHDPFATWRFIGTASSSRRAIPPDSQLSVIPGIPATDSTPPTADSSVWLPVTSGYSLQRDVAQLLVGRRIGAVRTTVVYALAGGEESWTALHVEPERRTLGPQDLDRQFAGLDVGFGLQAGAYHPIRWLLPDSVPLDVPIGLEAEIVGGWGRERHDGVPMRHLDAWLGGMSEVGSRLLVIGDVWVSGFQRAPGAIGIENGSVRMATTAHAAARRGTWTARVAWERLFAPDPDVHALANDDPIAQVVSPRSGLAEVAFTASLERGVHLWHPRHDWTVDGAVFGAASRRHGTLDPNVDDPSAVFADVVGLGIRLIPVSASGVPVRIDIGYPVGHSPLIAAHLYAALVVSHPLGTDRRRDGWRER